MSLEQVIHQRWRGDANLSSALPPTRLATGVHQPESATETGIAIPYATLTQSGEFARTRMSGGLVLVTAEITFRVWCESLTELKHLDELIARCFERRDFSLGRHRILDMRNVAHLETLQDDALWRLETTYHMRVEVKEKP
ncbi:MAG: hypothetical protein KDA42_07055 [Planctomycetales bacterium]|nr:hypothetical protein [Planctomycetales bacterium]